MNKRQEKKLQEAIKHMVKTKQESESIWSVFEAEKEQVLNTMNDFDLDNMAVEDEDQVYKICRVQGEKVEINEEEAKKLPKKHLNMILERQVEFDESAFKAAIKEHPEMKDFVKKFVTVNKKVNGDKLMELITLGEIDANKAIDLVKITKKKPYIKILVRDNS